MNWWLYDGKTFDCYYYSRTVALNFFHIPILILIVPVTNFGCLLVLFCISICTSALHNNIVYNTLQLLLFSKPNYTAFRLFNGHYMLAFILFVHSISQWLHLSVYWFARNNNRRKKWENTTTTEEYCLDNVRAIVMIALNSNKMLCNRIEYMHSVSAVHVYASASKCHSVCSCTVSLSLYQR